MKIRISLLSKIFLNFIFFISQIVWPENGIQLLTFFNINVFKTYKQNYKRIIILIACFYILIMDEKVLVLCEK